MKYNYDAKYLIDLLKNKRKREKVRQIVPLKYEEFFKTTYSSQTSDMFGEGEMLIFYDENDEVESIEIYGEEGEFFFLSYQVLGKSYGELKKFLDKNNINYKYQDLGLILNHYNMEFYIPNVDEDGDNAIVKSVYIQAF